MVFLKEFFEKFDIEQISRRQKKPQHILFGLIWIHTVWRSDGVPERIFWKIWFWKKSADDKKIMQNYPVGKELKFIAHVIQSLLHLSAFIVPR